MFTVELSFITAFIRRDSRAYDKSFTDIYSILTKLLTIVSVLVTNAVHFSKLINFCKNKQINVKYHEVRHFLQNFLLHPWSSKNSQNFGKKPVQQRTKFFTFKIE